MYAQETEKETKITNITMIRMWDKFDGVKAAGRQTNKVPTYVPYAHSGRSLNSWLLYECEQDIRVNRNASASSRIALWKMELLMLPSSFDGMPSQRSIFVITLTLWKYLKLIRNNVKILIKVSSITTVEFRQKIKPERKIIRILFHFVSTCIKTEKGLSSSPHYLIICNRRKQCL